MSETPTIRDGTWPLPERGAIHEAAEAWRDTGVKMGLLADEARGLVADVRELIGKLFPRQPHQSI